MAVLPAAAHADASTGGGGELFEIPCDGFGLRLDLSPVSDRDGHLHLTGTVTNVKTGRAGRYAEVQRDVEAPTGDRSAGLLSRVTVPGSGTYVVAGFAAADGKLTPHAADVADDAAIVAAMCQLLSR